MFETSASILTVTLSAAVDKAYIAPDFALGRVNRPNALHITAGGKGINVARVFQTLGGRAVATGFLAGRNGDLIEDLLAGEGIDSDFVRVAGESRICAAFVDPNARAVTELNETGPVVTHGDCCAVMAKMRELLPAHKAVIISGSIPPGAPPDLYANMIRLAQDEFGIPAILDASGEALIHGIKAQPYLAKPNVCEAAALDEPATELASCAKAIRSGYGTHLAMVTGGEVGAALASEDGAWEAMPPDVSVVSAVGSGDSVAAAFAWAMLQGYSLADALTLGVAAGTANALTASAGFLTREQVFSLADRIVAKPVD